jgi:hypothetical protein
MWKEGKRGRPEAVRVEGERREGWEAIQPTAFASYRLATRSMSAGCADLRDFDWAYKSNLYQIHRADVEELAGMEVGGPAERKDLICPFEIEPSAKAARQRFYQARLMEDVAQQVVVASFSPPEDKAYAAAGGTVSKADAALRRRSNGPRVKKPVSAKSLSEGRHRFRGGS